MKGRKMEDLEEHSGWSAATTAPMKKPGVSLSETPFAAPARGGIGGFGEAVRQSVTVAMSVAPSAETAWSHLRVIRPIVSPLVVLDARSCLRLRSDGSDARSELGDHLSEVISGGRIAGWGLCSIQDRLLAAFRRRGSVLIVFEGQDVLANLVDV
jgi:hypothetical protein